MNISERKANTNIQKRFTSEFRRGKSSNSFHFLFLWILQSHVVIRMRVSISFFYNWMFNNENYRFVCLKEKWMCTELSKRSKNRRYSERNEGSSWNQWNIFITPVSCTEMLYAPDRTHVLYIHNHHLPISIMDISLILIPISGFLFGPVFLFTFPFQ